jgi:uncharacterized phage-associated protein
MSRFEEAVLFVINSTSTKPDQLGRTKLAKILFFADLDAYRRTGKPMTDAVYEKRERGPMPRELYHAVNSLERQGMIATKIANHFDYPQHQFWALKEPEYHELTANDVAILSQMTQTICSKFTATSISEFSHNKAWELAETGEEIPYAAFLAAHGAGKPTATEIRQIELALGG